jgi:hypothetical protein
LPRGAPEPADRRWGVSSITRSMDCVAAARPRAGAADAQSLQRLSRKSMKQSIIAVSLALVAGASFARAAHAPEPAASGTVDAAASTEPGTPQRSKMKTCNADAKVKDLHGPDRKAFMKQCLSGKAKPAAAS